MINSTNNSLNLNLKKNIVSTNKQNDLQIYELESENIDSSLIDISILSFLEKPKKKQNYEDEMLKVQNSYNDVKSKTVDICMDSDPIECSSSLNNKNVIIKEKKKPKKKEIILTINGHNYLKKDLNQVNKKKRKKELLNEMKVFISKNIYEKYFDNRDISNDFDEFKIFVHDLKQPMIFWKRKTTAEFDENVDLFVPCSETDVVENCVIFFCTAEEMYKKIIENTFESEINDCFSDFLHYNQCEELNKIVLVYKYSQLIKRLDNEKNSRYKREILKRLNTNDKTIIKKKKEIEKILTTKEMDHILNLIQLKNKLNIISINSYEDIVKYLKSFTYSLSLSKYKNSKEKYTISNLNVIKLGNDSKSVFINSVSQFKLMTEFKSINLYKIHKSIYSLYNTLKKKGNLGDDFDKKNVVPPSVENAIKITLLSDNPDDLIY